MRVSSVLVLGALLLVAGDAAAQSPIRLSSPDFLFGVPKFSIAARGGWTSARAGSDWYDFVTETLTLDKKDFSRPAIGADVGIAIGRRAEAVVSVDFSQATSGSEYRDFVDNNRQPIEQTTKLRQTNLSGGVKYFLRPRGQEVSRLAWIPSKVVPFVGAGAGVLWFEMNQSGDFVDFADYSVFFERFTSKGVSPTGHVFGGVDLQLWRRFYATIDARYLWAAGDLGQDWVDFDPIDLTGMRVSAGINVIF